MAGSPTSLKIDQSLAAFALSKNYITQEQYSSLLSAISKQGSSSRLTPLLAERGYINRKQAEELLMKFRPTLFGKLALGGGSITKTQLQEALGIQSRSPGAPMLGSILVELGYLSKDVADRLAVSQKRMRDQMPEATPATTQRGRVPKSRDSLPTPRRRSRASLNRIPHSQHSSAPFVVGAVVLIGVLVLLGFALTTNTTDNGDAQHFNTVDENTSANSHANTETGTTTSPNSEQPSNAVNPADTNKSEKPQATVPDAIKVAKKDVVPAPPKEEFREQIYRREKPPREIPQMRAPRTWRSNDVELLTDIEAGWIVEKVDWVESDRLARVTLKPGIPNHWFLFSARGVVGKSIKFEIIGQRSRHGGYPWRGVKPLLTDTTDISNPLLYTEKAYEVAHKRLPWRRIDNAQYDPKTRTMKFETEFPLNEATISLKFPCPPSYVEKQITYLKANRNVEMFQAGTTSRGSPLRVLTIPKVSGNEQRWRRLPTLLLYGGEHATEHESSMTVMGALDWVASAEAASFREKYNTVLIPHISPDDTVYSIFDRCTDGFCGSTYGYGMENIQWAKFWNQWMDRGYSLDVAVNFHNVAGSESPNFFCPAEQYYKGDGSKHKPAFQSGILAELRAAGYEVGARKPRKAHMPSRLFGWLDARFGSCGLAFEVNSQWPKKNLSLTQLKDIGKHVLVAIDKQISDQILRDLRLRRSRRMASRATKKADILAQNLRIDWTREPLWATFNRIW